MNYKKETEIALGIVSGSYNNISRNNNFDKTSFVYKMTNEYNDKYKKYIIRRGKILIPTASGDQFLNACLYGVNQIDTYDISVFPKYFLKLKIAAVLNLTYEEYIKYFIKCDNYFEEFDEELYYKLNDSLDDNTKFFWDHLYSYFDGYEIYNSSLFSSEFISLNKSILENDYLRKENYYLLRERLQNIILRTFDLSIEDLNLIDEEYNIIELSNILNYYSNNDCYVILDNLPLRKAGIAIGYIHDVSNPINVKTLRLEKSKTGSSGIYIYRR